jgi:Putative transposase
LFATLPPEQVLNYLGRYTHRVAISNNRLLSVDDGKVAFRWKDTVTTTS